MLNQTFDDSFPPETPKSGSKSPTEFATIPTSTSRWNQEGWGYIRAEAIVKIIS